MSCLARHFGELRYRSLADPGFAALTRCRAADGRLRWRWPDGGYLLYRSEDGTWSGEYPVGIAPPGNRITETLIGRPLDTGTLQYRLRGFGPLGVEDGINGDDTPYATTRVTLDGGDVAAARPLAPSVWNVEPAADGTLRFTALVNTWTQAGVAQARALVPSVYRIVDEEIVGVVTPPAFSVLYPIRGAGPHTFVRDPELGHGETYLVLLRTVSAAGHASENVDYREVTIDSVGPVAPGLTLSGGCEDD